VVSLRGADRDFQPGPQTSKGSATIVRRRGLRSQPCLRLHPEWNVTGRREVAWELEGNGHECDGARPTVRRNEY
jgi:hypothetical protein